MDKRGKGVQINGDSETESNEKGWEKEKSSAVYKADSPFQQN